MRIKRRLHGAQPWVGGGVQALETGREQLASRTPSSSTVVSEWIIRRQSWNCPLRPAPSHLTEDVPCRSTLSGVGGRMLRPLRRSRAGRRGNLRAWRRGPGAQLAIRGASGRGVDEANAVGI